MLVYVLALLLQTTPISVFGHVQYYNTMEECNTAAQEMKKAVPAEKRNSIGCIRLVAGDVKEA